MMIKQIILSKQHDFKSFKENSKNEENRVCENRPILTYFTHENGHFLAIFRVGLKNTINKYKLLNLAKILKKHEKT